MLESIMIVIAVLIALVIVLALMGQYTFWLPGGKAAWPRLVMLHRVAPEAASGMNMPPERFECLLQVIKAKGYDCVTVSELVAAQNHERVLALTFDDGFADNYEYAFPLLKKYGAKATIYLAPDIADIHKLSPAQIAEMSDSGLIEFGAHTLHHVNLTQLDAVAAEAEIRASKARVAELAGECRSFAYPFGRFGAEHEKMVQAAGYDSAVSTRKKIEPLSAANRFRLPRISTNGAMNTLQMHIALAKGRYRL